MHVSAHLNRLDYLFLWSLRTWYEDTSIKDIFALGKDCRGSGIATRVVAFWKFAHRGLKDRIRVSADDYAKASQGAALRLR